MQIKFDKQDIIDSICVFVAATHNNGEVEDSEPHLVQNPEVFFDKVRGFKASGMIYGHHTILNQQQLTDAVALYLSAYYSFISDRLLINFNYDEANGEFTVDIVVEH